MSGQSFLTTWLHCHLFKNKLVSEPWSQYFGWYIFDLPGRIFWHYFAHRNSLFGRRRVDFDCTLCKRWLTTGRMTKRKDLEMYRAVRVDPEFYQGEFASYSARVNYYINESRKKRLQ